jgi:hypothetical protein
MNRPDVDQARRRPHLRTHQPPQRFTPPGDSNSTPATTTTSSKASTEARHFKPEAGDLRGIPICAPGVGGVQRGTHPEQEAIRRISRGERTE